MARCAAAAIPPMSPDDDEPNLLALDEARMASLLLRRSMADGFGSTSESGSRDITSESR